MAFPQTPLDVRTELLTGSVWTDITSYVYTRAPMTITYGRADEGTRADPGTLGLTLNNRDGRFSARNPMSPYYGLIGRNTPIRVSVPGTESYLDLAATGSATTPDASALDITADIDIRIEATADWYAAGGQTLAAKWSGANLTNASWVFALLDRTLIFQWAEDSATSVTVQQFLPALPPRAALRVTLDTTDPSGGFTGRLYWAPSMAGPWTQFGPDTKDPLASRIAASTAPLVIAGAVTGVAGLTGRVHRAEVRAGIDGTVVAAPDVRALAPGTTSWTDSAGRSWTVSGGTITNRHYRFTGEVSSWPPRWDVSGKDVWTEIEAAGILRRMGQGRKALSSTLSRRIPSAPGLLAYWPMEEEQGSTTQAYSPTSGVRPLTATGMDWAANDTLRGSAALPTLQNPARLSAVVPSTTVAGWQVECVYFLPTMPTTQTEILRVAVAGSTMRTAHVYASTAGIRIEARDSDDVILTFFIYSPTGALADFVGVWNRLAIFTSDEGGGQTRLTVCWRDITADSFWRASTLITGTMGRATAITGTWGAGTEGMTIGHLSAIAVPGNGIIQGSLIYDEADTGFDGEAPLTRLERLTQEEPALLLRTQRGDTSLPAQLMGPQRPAALMDLLTECADTDGGILYEDLTAPQLLYRERSTLYNQLPVLVLDYTAEGEVAPPLEPVEDDAHLRNDVTITREGGSSGRAVVDTGPLSVLPPEQGGAGIYDEAVTLSLHSDDQAQPIAAWRAYLGTVDEARYPSIHLQLHTAPHLIDSLLRLRIGDKAVITNPPAWLPPDPIEALVYGYTEVLDQFTWDVVMNAVPARPWTVAVAGDPDSRADAASSHLTTTVTASATTLQVTTDGSRWADSATYAADFPFNVQVGGEVMTVTAIAGTASPQTFTVIRSVNQIVKSHTAGASVRLANPSVAAL